MSIEKLLAPAAYLVYPADGKGTTQQQYQSYVINQNAVLSAVVGSAQLWQPSTELATGSIVRSPSMTANTVAKVTTSGITGTVEPTWTDAGTTVTDNGVTYLMIQECQEAATLDEALAGTDTSKTITPAVLAGVLAAIYKQAKLDAHPVGSIYQSTVSTSPAVLFGGTWTEWVDGRTLISRSNTHAAGTTAGEETHALTKDEMPKHDHTGDISGTTGEAGSHSHGFYQDTSPRALRAE